MSDTALATRFSTAQESSFHLSTDEGCEECAGTGGWFRYEPALDPAPGRLYLSCLGCKGSGRMADHQG